MRLTENDLNKSVESDIQKTIQEIVKSSNQIMINERLLSENNTPQSQIDSINEGLWEKVKYGLSKLGRYKAGGKIFGKGKIDQEAGAKIQSIIDKKGNEVIKALNSKLKETNPEFPNNEKGNDFLKTVLEISAVYDTLVASTKKDSKDEGFLPIDIANGIIEDLAEYVKKYLDVDLAASYSVMDSKKDEVGKDGEVDGKEELLADSVEDINEEDDEHDAGDVRTQLQAKKGEGGTNRESERMKTLKSNKLPLILTAVGGSLGSLGWLAQTEWLKHLIEGWLNTDGIPGEDAIYKTISGGKPDVEGMVHWMRSIDPSNPIKDGGDILEFIKTHGAENVSHMFDGNGAGDSMDQVNKLTQLVGGDGSNQGVGELFKSDTFGDMKGGRNLFGISKAASFVTKTLIKSATKAVAGSTAGTILATKVASIGAVLAPLGIGVLAAGALVKLMRMKGQKQSRAKTLNDLLQSIQPIKAEERPNNPPVLPPNPNKPDPGKPDEDGNKPPTLPPNFLKGNRNMQLAYLSELFLPQGKGLWDRLGLKKGTVIPSGFLDAALGQGKQDSGKYLKAFYNHLKKENSFVKDPGNPGAWMTKIKSNESQALIKWVRNTRKNIGSFLKAINKEFPDFEIGKRAKAKTIKPGKRGEAMGTSGINDSIENKLVGLLTEDINLGNLAAKSGFDKSLFMKNLPQFMEMISSMYYGIKGSKLPYNKEEVLKVCKSFGCTSISGSGYEKTKSDDYVLQPESKTYSNKKLTEEVEKMKDLFNRMKK